MCNKKRTEGLSSRKDALSLGASLGLFVGASLLSPSDAKAELTLAQRKVSYFRYAPRIKSGRDFFCGEFKKVKDLLICVTGASLSEMTWSHHIFCIFCSAPPTTAPTHIQAIDSKNWAAVSAAYEVQGQAPESSMRVRRFLSLIYTHTHTHTHPKIPLDWFGNIISQNNPQRYIDKFEKDLFSPMKVYSQSFAEKGVSPNCGFG